MRQDSINYPPPKVVKTMHCHLKYIHQRETFNWIEIPKLIRLALWYCVAFRYSESYFESLGFEIIFVITLSCFCMRRFHCTCSPGWPGCPGSRVTPGCPVSRLSRVKPSCPVSRLSRVKARISRVKTGCQGSRVKGVARLSRVQAVQGEARLSRVQAVQGPGSRVDGPGWRQSWKTEIFQLGLSVSRKQWRPVCQEVTWETCCRFEEQSTTINYNGLHYKFNLYYGVQMIQKTFTSFISIPELLD